MLLLLIKLPGMGFGPLVQIKSASSSSEGAGFHGQSCHGKTTSLTKLLGRVGGKTISRKEGRSLSVESHFSHPKFQKLFMDKHFTISCLSLVHLQHPETVALMAFPVLYLFF